MSYSVPQSKKKGFPPLSFAGAPSPKPKLTLAPVLQPAISTELPTPEGDRTIRLANAETSAPRTGSSSEDSIKRMQQLHKAIHGLDLHGNPHSDVDGTRTPLSSGPSSMLPSPFERTSSSGSSAASIGGLKEPASSAREKTRRGSNASDRGADYQPSDFQDLGRLGEGAAGEVRKVLHVPTGQVMAQKVGRNPACCLFAELQLPDA